MNAQGAQWDCRCIPVNVQGDQWDCTVSGDGPGVQWDCDDVSVCAWGMKASMGLSAGSFFYILYSIFHIECQHSNNYTLVHVS